MSKRSDPKELARECDLFMHGAKKLYDEQGERADMWLFELYHHLDDCRAALAAAQRVAGEDSAADLLMRLRRSTCFGKDVCQTLPCACAEALAVSPGNVGEPQPFNAVEQLREFREKHPEATATPDEEEPYYFYLHGPRCRECADFSENGICPHDGRRCDGRA